MTRPYSAIDLSTQSLGSTETLNMNTSKHVDFNDAHTHGHRDRETSGQLQVPLDFREDCGENKSVTP